MKRYILACMTVAVVFGGLVASVKADDIYPPTWLRGQPTTTYGDWTFATSANPAAPDLGLYNPNGNPTATITGGTWHNFYDNHVGVWTLGSSSSMDFFIPNTPFDAGRYKLVWTQVTWQPDTGGSPLVTVNGVGSTLILSAPAGNGGWLQNVYETFLFPNPASEDVIISGTMDVGQVVIDTVCVPEPSSLVLLAIGALSLLPCASRKRKLAA
jgi:hypothetical protein